MGNDLSNLMQEGKRFDWNGDNPGAENAYRRALSLAESMYGIDAAELIEPLCALASTLSLPGGDGPSARRADAVILMRRALGIAEAHFGMNDRGLVRILSRLALGLDMNGQPLDAYEHAMRALNIADSFQGDAGDARDLPRHLAALLLTLGRPEQALPFAERALRLEEACKSQTASAGLGLAYRALGMCLMGVGRGEEAIVQFERCLALFRSRHPDRKPRIEDEILGWIDELRRRAP
ncbi:MAG: tetratricopeptide repeat protein, partial [Polyangiaceae bacterium]|nr:tetratricopeptide repeat protein [Polyangiaceae bacterium]